MAFPAAGCAAGHEAGRAAGCAPGHTASGIINTSNLISFRL